MTIIDLIIFIFGAMIGSFLNVCIVRMPQEKSIAFPSSHCVHCKKPIHWFDNIPLISWLMLGGKCRSCKGNIAFRYWFIELLTAVSFVLFYRYFGLDLLLLPYLFMLGCFIVATFVDFEHRIIPDQVSVGGMFVGLAFSAVIPQLHQITLAQAQLGGFLAGLITLICLGLILIYPIFCKHLMEGQEQEDDRDIRLLVMCSLIGIIVLNLIAPRLPLAVYPYALSLSAALSGYIIGGGIIYAMGLFGDILFKKESMGGGDVKLMAMVGAFMGWELAVLTFFLAPFAGAVVGIIEKIRTKDSTMAYGPFLVMGALISLFWGHQIIDWVLRGGIYGN